MEPPVPPHGISEVIHPVRPATDPQPSGTVQQQATTTMQQTVQAAVPHLDVAQPAAEQIGTLTEVVPDADRGDRLDQVTVHLVQISATGRRSP